MYQFNLEKKASLFKRNLQLPQECVIFDRSGKPKVIFGGPNCIIVCSLGKNEIENAKRKKI